jgi:hypothetical protein
MTMDLYDTKSRIAEAFVESIFRRARFHVRPYEARPALRIGHEDFSPNFAVSRNSTCHEILVAVKFRPSVDQFLSLENQRRASIFELARRNWPALYFVVVTDHPAPGRSCFQALPLAGIGGPPFETVDLAALSDLQIFPHNVADHEALMMRLLGLLSRGRDFSPV